MPKTVSLVLIVLVTCRAAFVPAVQNTYAAKTAKIAFVCNPLGIKGLTPDTHVALRGTFKVDEPGTIEFKILGAHWFVAWLDGEYFTEGPARFPRKFPEYEIFRKKLSPGIHVIAVHLYHPGLTTRILQEMPSFFACQAVKGGKTIPISWRCLKLPGYRSRVRRINPQLGWIEWCDTRLLPEKWRATVFDDTTWQRPDRINPGIGKPAPLQINHVHSVIHNLHPLAQGPLAEKFGYEMDDIPARFFLRDLVCQKLPPQGIWRRYDLGRVRLGRPRFVLDLPPGAVVEFAYCEELEHNRVSPYITLSAGPSCNLDHFVARGGRQEFFPLTPKGGRFMEIHILANPDKIKFIRQEYLERTYHGPPQGSFRCSDELLNRIWLTGINTYRSCTEDAVIDNPTRERGQWTGDVVTVGMDIAAVGYADISLLRRGLIQSAQSARKDGLVAGLCPGGGSYLSTYAAQWVSACLHYWELTGDIDLLMQLFPSAERNIAAFEKHRNPDGIADTLGWGFVDWGYVRNSGPTDIAVDLHYLAALQDMIRWAEALGKTSRVAYYRSLVRTMRNIISRYYKQELGKGAEAWTGIGYHRAVLGLRLGFFKDQQERSCLAFIKSHMLRCFPNDPTAPRLSDPAANNPRLITPYFGHYAMQALLEHGEINFVLDQYRKCWGWALSENPGTWLEVFDTRWSRCHQWAGCPTWQLSRYVLGLITRYDMGDRHFVLSLRTGNLQSAEGKLPLPGGAATILIKWRKQSDGIHYQLKTPIAIYLHVSRQYTHAQAQIVPIDKEFQAVFPLPGTIKTANSPGQPNQQ